MNISININFYLGGEWPVQSINPKTELQEHFPSDKPFIARAREEIEKTNSLCSRSTTKNRKTAVNAFERFLQEEGKAGLTADGLTCDMIKAFETWQLEQSLRLSYVRCNHRNLRVIVDRITGRGKDIFKGVRTSNTQTEKRAVDEETIKRLEESRFPEGSRKTLARYVFLFCFYAMGIPLIDAAYLKKKQYKDGQIIYYRHKTHRQVKVKVTPELKQIIDKLSPKDSPYLLPILTSEDRDEAERQYKRFQQKYNRTLAEISEEFGMEAHLTSYTPRHTWASIAFAKGISINVISQALGHSNTRTTQNYIRELRCDQLEDANMVVIRHTKERRNPGQREAQGIAIY